MAGFIYYRGVRCVQHEVKKLTLTSTISFFRNNSSNQNNEPSFGLLFDIDGVIVRGKKVIPNVPETFKKLVNSEGKFRIPTVFLTNAGNGLTRDKAQQLSEWLNIKVTEEHVVMAHSPLKVFNEYHDKNVLVSGQGPIEEISRRLGFKSIVTIDDVRKAFPLLDAVDHKRRVSQPVSHDPNFSRIEAVVLFGEPVRWETVLQLLIDVLMTNGDPRTVPVHHTYPHIPVLACNMDLQWMAEANMPRFGHGAFLLCLEDLYKKITGKDLIYKALIGKPSELTYRYAQKIIMDQANKIQIGNRIKRLYAIGDNLNTDIFGANLYNECLSSGKTKVTADASFRIEEENCSVCNCYSVLVKTGVYSHELSNSELDHSPRDFLNFGHHYRQPSYTVQDVSEAIDMIFQLEAYK
ncbi:haloacid dehalogenase-like hydrolase domain-containing 5 [Homalodisca vitripennis]|uniref:haloacid dehalogenase-like hydrolase domain-containing 5 n=1 Tax=Homalodisca vitripennis TaxID=197043 RepID=UPI001EEA111B|nr:haloacid dehalogenase-like hydrolase domain-containing 5 [Homalodisca vitripennis]